MDFIDRIQALAAQVPKQIEHIQTEEATKSALVMPFINALGYNVFDPSFQIALTHTVKPTFLPSTVELPQKGTTHIDALMHVKGKILSKIVTPNRLYAK